MRLPRDAGAIGTEQEKEAMKALIKGVTDLFDAWDDVQLGAPRSRSSRYHVFQGELFYDHGAAVDPTLNAATELLGRSCRRLQSLGAQSGEPGRLRTRTLGPATHTATAHRAYLEALTGPWMES